MATQNYIAQQHCVTYTNSVTGQEGFIPCSSEKQAVQLFDKKVQEGHKNVIAKFGNAEVGYRFIKIQC